MRPHSRDCGTRYRGCAPDCPKDREEKELEMNHLIKYDDAGNGVAWCGASLGSLDALTELVSAIDCPKCRKASDKLVVAVATENEPYQELGMRVGALVDEKQKAYGDSFGRSGAVLRALYPDGISVEQYDDMLAIVRIVDKLFRVATHGSKDPMQESPGRDIAGYGLLMARRHEK